ncbi:hypothetical protein H0H81_000561 [Sphagnurus paluster]|uniref:Amino acid permease/ SLC12A domain-containing protein n=1 Tax=Sphagnurus paluster TaxID=117069 RepID=A0A9P7FMS5_9AGAR|nr:hypothetical protein H0H81_000561 [Sphagnurus paluster]
MSDLEKNTDNVEKGVIPAKEDEHPVFSSQPGYTLDVHDIDRVQRRLKQRHAQILSPQIAGTIGTGLFLGSGHALQGAGPLGALMAYALVGTVAYA